VHFVRFGSSEQDFYFQHIVNRERLGFILEICNQFKSFCAHLDTFFVVKLLQINYTHVGQRVLIFLVNGNGLIVFVKSFVELSSVEKVVSIFFHFLGLVPVLDCGDVFVDPCDFHVTEYFGELTVVNHCLEVGNSQFEITHPNLGTATLY